MKETATPASDSITRVIKGQDQQQLLEVRAARLVVQGGPDRDVAVEMKPSGLVVGTAPECDLVLSDTAVSRRHFELVPVEDGFLLRDLGSKNGTRIGRLRLKQAVVSGGEEILIGESRLLLQLLDDLQHYPLSTRTSFGALLGRSVPMRQVFAILERVAPTESIVLLEGESGTGKDLAAEAIHLASSRRKAPFVVLDCGAIRPTLIESELFGHLKGAFTGAERDRAGVFESANGGTVFLDEIGEIEPAQQLALLRLLDKKQIKRLGENRYRSVDVRLIAATNRDLTADVQVGRFRQDLYFRLSVVRLVMPPLRDRIEDIPLLARSLVQRLRSDLNPAEVISQEVLALFVNHDWPGNVRELRNVVERILIFPEQPHQAMSWATGPQRGLTADLMAMPFGAARETLVGRFERMYLTAALEAAGGVVAKACEHSGIPRPTFYRLLAKHGLTRK